MVQCRMDLPRVSSFPKPTMEYDASSVHPFRPLSSDGSLPFPLSELSRVVSWPSSSTHLALPEQRRSSRSLSKTLHSEIHCTDSLPDIDPVIAFHSLRFRMFVHCHTIRFAFYVPSSESLRPPQAPYHVCSLEHRALMTHDSASSNSSDTDPISCELQDFLCGFESIRRCANVQDLRLVIRNGSLILNHELCRALCRCALA